MSNYTEKFVTNLLSIPRIFKKALAITTDFFLCIFSTWLALSLRSEDLILFNDLVFYLALISIAVAIPIFWIMGLYKIIFRYTDLSIILSVFFSTLVYGLIFYFIISLNINLGVSKIIGIMQPIILFFTIIISRLGVRYILAINSSFRNYTNKKNVLIYGAGSAGRQLLIAINNSPNFEVMGFLDDNEQLQKQLLLGKVIYSPSKIENLVQIKNVSLVFLAMPKIGRNTRNQIINNLNKHQLIVKSLPSISEIVEGKITLSDVKDYNIDDLLNRDEVKADEALLNKNIKSKIVMVTGGGGSIGSELCRQIIKFNPKSLLILELNEFALYKIYNELTANKNDIKIVPLLCNVQNQRKIEIILDTYKVNTIYHTAAYKHVPLVEENICEGIKNNVFGSLAVVNASISNKVSTLVLISSDKAVRSTNVMGASKRLSELCMQGIHHEKDHITDFSIVRFGNVLESSGSVIPKFKKQIESGGPVTLTHKDVTRYFMTVTEAAQLVIQAGAMGKKSEVFVLDMGQSVKIKDLIHKMIALSGLKVKGKDNPNGDIEIKIIGLKPGEKLFEELLIGDNPEKTNHPKILKIDDPYIPFKMLKPYLDNLKYLCDENNVIEVRKLLEKLLKSYAPNSKVVDQIYIEQKQSSSFGEHKTNTDIQSNFS